MPFGGPIGGDPGGGGGITPPSLSISPSGAINFGTVAIGSSKDISLVITNDGGETTQITAIEFTNPPFTLINPPNLPVTLTPGASLTLDLHFSPISAVTSNTTLSITASSGTDNSPYSAAVSGTGAGASAALQVTPGPVVFPDTISTHAAAPIAVTVKNVGGATVDVQSIAMLNGLPFALTGLPALPLALNPGNTTTFNVTFNPTSISGFSDTLRIGTDVIGNVDTVVQGNGVALIPVAIIANNVKQVVFAFQTPSAVAHKNLDPTTLNNADFGATLVFNGALWNDPGNERTLIRLEVFYENYGAATITVTVTAFRPLPNLPDNFQTVTKQLTLGTALADLSERVAFADINISGELITLQITKAANGGPLSLIGFLPHWEPKGEKIANT